MCLIYLKYIFLDASLDGISNTFNILAGKKKPILLYKELSLTVD